MVSKCDSLSPKEKLYQERLITELSGVKEGLFAISEAIIFHAKHLGLKDAATPMGAIEAFSKFQSESLENLANAVSSLGNVNEISEGLNEIAKSLAQKSNGQGGDSL